MRYGKIMICFLTIVFLVTAVAFGSMDAIPEKEEETVSLSVSVTTGNRTEVISCWEQAPGTYYVFLPAYAAQSRLTLRTSGKQAVTVDGLPVEDGMPLDAVLWNEPYAIEIDDGENAVSGTITLLPPAELPALYIHTQSGNMDYIHEEKGNKESGSIRIYGVDGTVEFAGNLKSISGRGNGTWTSEKKSYSLSLAGEADLLGMGEAQKWILLANDGDPSHLRNKLVYDFARDAGMAYAPESGWVELYLNGEYAGLYQLCERNEIHPQRVDMEEDNSFLVSLELEKRLVEQKIPYAVTESGRALRIHHSSMAAEELAIRWQSVENAIFAEDGRDPATGSSWQELIDVDSWARKYLIEELFGNGDAGGLSQFFYGDGETGKIYAGPVWDFDISMGSSGVWQQMRPQAFFANRERLYRGMDTSWYHALWQKEEFSTRVKQLYREEFRPLLEKYLQETLYDYAGQIDGAAERNRLRWDRASAMEAAEQIETFMLQRIDFLDSLWLEEETWYSVLVDINDGSNIACYALRPGEALPQLPDITGIPEALGWYHRETDLPVDLTQPVTGDMDIYCKRQVWEDGEQDMQAGLSPMERLPLLVFLMILCFSGMREIFQLVKTFRKKRKPQAKVPQN